MAVKRTIKNKVKLRPIKTIDCEVAIAKLFDVRRSIIVPNISWGLNIHEMELCIIRKSGLMIEVEIKISKSDLIKDFEKWHNHKDRFNRITEFYYAMPDTLYEKCKDLIPKDAGVIVCYWYKKYNGEYIVKASLKKKSKKSFTSRKLNENEINKVLRLGTMRIFKLKEKIINLQYGNKNS